MPRISSIQWKALFLLVTFTASFTVFCHCACAAAAVHAKGCHRSCCDKSPQKEDNGCQGMQAVKLNLQERQTAHSFLIDAAPFMGIVNHWFSVETVALVHTDAGKLPQQWSYKHSPPNLLVFYQRFLI